MKKQLTIATLGILMLAGAMAMYSGETISFETNFTNPVYTVFGNNSNLDGLSVEYNNGNITISTDPLMASDNFTLVFFDEVTKEVIKTIRTGGRRIVTEYVDKNITVYIPEYINTIETIEVEKIIEVEVIQEGKSKFPSWIGYVTLIIGVILIIISKYKIKEDKNA